MGMTKMGVAAIFETRGNPDGHVILRGGKAPNYDADAGRRGLRRAAQGRPARAGDGRLLARQLGQAAPPADRRGGRHRARSKAGERASPA
jgi:hypothetical protein